MVYCYKFTHTNIGVSLPSLAFGIPAILFALLFGVLVDRFRKKNILLFSDIARAVLIIFLPGILKLNGSLVVIFLVSFLIFTIAQLFIPAEIAAIPMLVEKQELILANSLFMGSWMMASIIGFAIAVPIHNVFGANAVSGLIMSLYLLAGLLIFFIKLPEHVEPRIRTFQNLIRELRIGIRFVVKHRIAFYAMFQMGFGLSIIAVISVLIIGFAERNLGMQATDFGYLVALSGLGMGVGIALMSKLLKYFNKLQLIFGGFSIIGLMLICLGFNKDVGLAFVIIFVLGVGNAFINAPAQTIIQERTPANIRGRVFSVQNLITSLAFTLPPVLAGFLADHFGYKKIFLALGIIALIFNFTIRKLEK